ncbi:MAG: hypothetical protein AB7K24_10585, partial [Gemmataceae bacterium]
MTVPEFLQPFLGTSPQTARVLYGIVAGVVLFVLFLLWLRFGRTPRRRRAARAAQAALNNKDWQTANTWIAVVKRLAGRSSSWAKQLRRLEGKCLQLAAEESLGAAAYEEALERLQQAAACLELDPAEGKRRVLETMHAHLHRLFVEKKEKDLEDLATRILRLAPASGSPYFWQALSRLRQART